MSRRIDCFAVHKDHPGRRGARETSQSISIRLSLSLFIIIFSRQALRFFLSVTTAYVATTMATSASHVLSLQKYNKTTFSLFYSQIV